MEFQIKTTIQASAQELYRSWLSSEGHTKMTGGEATNSGKVGGAFTAWDGYIEGKNLVLEPHLRIVQSWRTSEFETHEPDSELEILFKEREDGTEITLNHRNLPAHGEQYRQGWVDHYFNPMKAYFERGI
jgi:activator of HSP90 ATPase